MTDLDLLRFDWLVGDSQDVISVMDTRQADAWPLLELSPTDAITFAMRLMEVARDALHAYYPDGRSVADGRIPMPAAAAAEDYFAVDEPIPLLPADTDPPPRDHRRDAIRGFCPTIGRRPR